MPHEGHAALRNASANLSLPANCGAPWRECLLDKTGFTQMVLSFLPACRATRRAIIPGKTKLVIVESPTNPRMQICDIAAIAAMAKQAGKC